MHDFNLSVIGSNLPQIGAGFVTTLGMWLVSVALGAALGLGVALIQQVGGTVVRAIIRAYVELFRGTPFLVQLFLLYYGGPAFGLTLTPIVAGVVSLTLYGGAYFAEVFRGGFASVPKGHLEAAACLGLSRWQAIWRIQLPQMLALILPALSNLTIVLSKETAVLSVVTVPELTFVLTGIGSATFAYVQTLLMLSVCYLALVELATYAGNRAERRVSRFLA
jgi:polar amino acid transport system permease protein